MRGSEDCLDMANVNFHVLTLYKEGLGKPAFDEVGIARESAVCPILPWYSMLKCRVEE